MKNTKEFLSNFTQEEIKALAYSVNSFHCAMKENSKDRVENGKITEQRYRELRRIEALLSYMEVDLFDMAGGE